MSVTHPVIKDYLIGFAFILTMVIAATLLNDYEIILPEIGALTAGTWVYHNLAWIAEPRKIFLAPSGTAIIGFLINQLAITYAAKVYLTLLLILGLLSLLRSTLAPSFATGLLPIIINATHWSFILAIVTFILILALGVRLQGHYQGLPASQPLHLTHMLKFTLTASIWVAVVWLAGFPQMAGIPPVLVVFFEVSQMPVYPGKLALRQIVALSGAATIGVVVHLILASWLLTTLITLPLVYGLLTLLRLKLPAAYAFPLLALVLPTPMFHLLPIAASLAAGFFLGSVWVTHKVLAWRAAPSENNI